MALKFLFVADERSNRRILRSGLGSDACEIHAANSRAAIDSLLQQHGFHAACLDARMVDDDPRAVMSFLRARVPRLPVVVVAERSRRTSLLLSELAPEAHLLAPFSNETLRQALEAQALREARSAAAEDTPAATKIVARDEAARRMVELALRAAASNVSILILGETGTGKNLLAQTIHEQSPLRNSPFVTVSCPSLNRELLESDLFGHVRGAFTGAVQDTWGKVAAAEGGTLFLDEIGDLPLTLQPKLLRLLQERQYERVGEATPRSASVRILAATNRDLKAEVAAGRFREDLYYRLNVITLDVPPLRMRPGDIMPAAEMFLSAICSQLGKRAPSFSPDTRALLEAYSWPGNLRELRNAVERAAVLSDAATLHPRDFPGLSSEPPVPRFRVGAPISLAALETAHIQAVVASTSTLEEAARILKIDKSTLYRKRRAMDARIERFAPAEDGVLAFGG
jgi:NtrC-family two-component system response regulator AlgB